MISPSSSMKTDSTATGDWAFFPKSSGMLIFSLALLIMSLLPLDMAYSQGIFDSIRQNREYKAGVSLLREGDYSLAQTQFERFLEDYPNSSYRPHVIFGLAESYYLQNHYDSASIYYQRSLTTPDTLAERFIPTALRRGLKSARRIGSDRITQSLLDRMDRVPESLITNELLKEVVRSAQAIGHVDRAIQWARVGERITGNRMYWTYRRGVINAQDNRLDPAIQALQAVPDTAGLGGEARFLLGEIALQRSQLDTASHHYNAVRDNKKLRFQAEYGLGWVAIKQEEYDTAIRHLKTAAESDDPIGRDASLDLARLYRTLKRVDQSKTWYKHTLKRLSEPKKSRIRIEFADYLVEQDQLLDAVSHYAEAQSLELESKQHLIRGYIISNRYEKALEELHTLQSKDQLTGPRWMYYRALAEFESGKVQAALDTIQTISVPDDPSLKGDIYSLYGSILFAQEQFSDALSLYKRWMNETGALEARYYLGLLKDRSNNTDQALDLWQFVRNNGKQPWATRASFQLFRVYHERNQPDRKATVLTDIQREHLSPQLKVELDLIRWEENLNRDGYTDPLRKQAEKLLGRARSEGLRDLWYRTLLNNQPPKTWWQNLLLPVLREDPEQLRELAVPTLRALRKRGWSSLSLSTGDYLLKSMSSADARRQVRIQQMRTLTASERMEEIPTYLPSQQQWSNWSDRQALRLAEYLHRYHQAQRSPKRGLEALNTLTNQASLGNPERMRIDQWKASLELQLEQFTSAKSRLDQWPASELSRSGRLNRAIAEYHEGDTTTSLHRIENLENAWDTPPIEYYDYAFRNLRKHGFSAKLAQWVEQFKQSSYEDSQAVDLILDNALFWIQNDSAPRAIAELQLLEDRAVTPQQIIQIQFYQGLGYFNSEDFDRAHQILMKLQNTHELKDRWTFRTAQLLTEINLRQKNWKKAYKSWETLDSLNQGGQLGQRLLTSRGLTQETKIFSRLLDRMGEKYPEYLPEHLQLYWRGRLHEQENQKTKAIDTYNEYIESENQTRLFEVRRRLANLYETTDQTDRALEQYEILWNQTQNPRSLVNMARQHRKLSNYSRARELLNKALEEWPQQKGWIHYELARIHREQSNPGRSIQALEIALDQASDTAEWASSARQILIREALNQNQLETVRVHLNSLENDIERGLFRAELLRREGNLDEALNQITTLVDRHDTEAFRGPFEKIASAVYFENEKYQHVLKILPDTPPTNQQTELALLSSLETDQPDQAERLYGLLPNERRTELAGQVGQYYFSNKQWEKSLDYFQQAPGTFSNQLMMGKTLRELGRPKDAYTTLTESFSRSDSDVKTAFHGAMFSELQTLTSSLGRENQSASLLNDHWEFVDTEKSDTFARLGLRWSLEAGNQELTRKFLNRMDRISSNRFIRIANRFEQRQWWSLLENWVNKFEPSSSRESVARTYYVQRVSLSDRPDTTFVKTTQELIDRAMNQNSAYAPRLQHLLGTYYFQQEQYERAAIEYSKVSNLFERTPQTDRSKLGLAHSYARLDRTEKAQEIFQELAEQTNQESVRKEAEQWLEKNL